MATKAKFSDSPEANGHLWEAGRSWQPLVQMIGVHRLRVTDEMSEQPSSSCRALDQADDREAYVSQRPRLSASIELQPPLNHQATTFVDVLLRYTRTFVAIVGIASGNTRSGKTIAVTQPWLSGTGRASGWKPEIPRRKTPTAGFEPDSAELSSVPPLLFLRVGAVGARASP